jgi:hypothetical protein
MGKISEWLGGLFATTLGLAIMVFTFLSLPFSIVAMMRWFDFPWWGALLAAMVLPAIPIIGWIAYAVLAIAGCYFFIAEGYSFQRASTSPTEVSSTSTPAQVAFKKSCLDNRAAFPDAAAKRGWSVNQYEDFCECAAALMYRKLTLQELEYAQIHNQPSPAFQKEVAAEIGKCAP